MNSTIKIICGETEVTGRLNESGTAGMIDAILPVTGTVNLWGDEIYFAIPLKAGPENARETVSLGDIAYWPEGNALCLFLGKTPVSTATEIKPISPVNIVGHLDNIEALLSTVKPGDKIVIRR